MVAIFALAISSCRDNDFDWEEYYCESAEYRYEKIFEEVYGKKIDPNQSWDFSSYADYTDSISDTRATRADDDDDDPVRSIGDGADFGFVDQLNGDVLTQISDGYHGQNYGIYQNAINATKDIEIINIFESPGQQVIIYPVVTKCDYNYAMCVKVEGYDEEIVFKKDSRFSDSNKVYAHGVGLREGTSGTVLGEWVDINGTLCNDENGYKVYSIKNKQGGPLHFWGRENRYLNHSSSTFLSKDESSKYAIIRNKKNEDLYLYGIDGTPGFIKLGTTKGNWGTTYPAISSVEFAGASILSFYNSNNNTFNIKLGEYYLFSNNFFNNRLGIKKRLSNNDNYKWTMQSIVLDNSSEKIDELKSALTLSQKAYIEKVNMPGFLVNVPAGKSIEIYIKLLDSNGNPTGERIGIDTGHAAELNYYTPLEESSGTGIKYYGISKDDNSCNELVFATVGTNSYSSISKRYMVEDLDANQKSDIDFNDIVVDLETKKYVLWQTTATIKALGGTLNLTMNVNGNPVFTKGSTNSETTGVLFNPDYKIANVPISSLNAGTMYNTNRSTQEKGDGNYDTNSWIVKFPVWGWNGNNSRVSFTIPSPNQDATSTNTITFPKIGQRPKMVAFDIYKLWNQERVEVYNNWFTNQK